MLGGRKIIAVLAGETLEGFVSKGCLQQGMLSPRLRSLVVDKLIRILDKNRCYTLVYADDIAILTSGKFYRNHLGVFKLFTSCILNQYFHLIYQLIAFKMYMTLSVLYSYMFWLNCEPSGSHPKWGKALDVNREPALQVAIDCLGSRTLNP
jgi:hypothetical protein